MAHEARPMNGPEWGMLVALSVLWGGAFFFAGVAVRELPPLTVVLARVGLAALALLPLFWLRGHSLPRTLAGWLPFLVMGVLNNAVPFGLLFVAQTMITVGLASIINAMTPLFTVIVMAVFAAERLTPGRVAGVLLGIAGVVVLRGFETLSADAQTLGIGLALLATLSYGFAALWGRRYLAAVPPLKSATCQLICSTLVMAVAVTLVDAPWTLAVPSLHVIGALVGLALLATALAYILFFEILVRAGASNVMLVTLLIPVSGLLLGHLFLDEAIHVREVAGAAIIGLGLLAIDGRPARWLLRTVRTR